MMMQEKSFAELVKETLSLICDSRHDAIYSNTTRNEIEIKLSNYLDIIKNDGILPTQEIQILFAPTGCICETALDNGWGDEYFAIANRIDSIIAENM